MADAKLTALTETSVPALDDLSYQVDVSDTTDDAAGSSRKLANNRLLGLLTHVCQGRLTTESGVPVSTSDRTSQSTIYFTPYHGNLVSLYDGTRWKLYTFTERSLALSGLTSGKNYDVFLYDNAGTLTLELSAAWTNDTTRADALTTQDGVHVKSGSTTRRLVGTIRTTGTTTTEDSGGGSSSQVGGKRYVWNLYNRVPRPLAVIDTADTWSYATNTTRQANAASGNKVEYVVGLSLDAVTAAVLSTAYNSGSAPCVGVGVDSTSTFSGLRVTGAVSGDVPLHSRYVGYPGIGYHYLAWCERGNGSGSITWTGDVGVSGERQSGLSATVMG